MILDAIIISVFVFEFPGWEWLGVVIVFLRHILFESTPKRDYKSDEFDWWQDNQGLTK